VGRPPSFKQLPYVVRSSLLPSIVFCSTQWHYTPKHGSWLDLAESELGVLSSQCLDRRIADKQTLIEEIVAWQDDRNAKHTKANWHFTTPDARIKLKHLYPSI
jgi:hypothetical protein